MSTRVLQVVYGLGMGGAETWLMSLLKFYKRMGEVDTDILITCGERRFFDDEAESHGARLHYIPYNRSQVLPFRRAFQNLLRMRRYDAIHDHQDIHSGFHFMLAGRAPPPIRITHIHNPSYHYGVSAARRLTIKVGMWLVRRHSTHVLGTSNHLLGEYGFHDDKYRDMPIGSLHCGFDTQLFRGELGEEKAAVYSEFGWSISDKLVLFAGRLDYDPEPGASRNHKNSAFALYVLIAAMKQRADLVAVFVGSPSPALRILEQRVVNSGLEGRIVFAGVRQDIPRLMLASDTLFFPSRGEGLGMVAVEAQAAGLPVLASTAVPRECVVVPDLVRFMDLDRPITEWITALLVSVDRQVDRGVANAAVHSSAFSIENSAKSLHMLYSTGVLPLQTPDI